MRCRNCFYHLFTTYTLICSTRLFGTLEYTWSLEGRSLLVSPLKDYWCPFLRRRRKVEPTLEIKRYPIHEPVSKEYNFLLNLCNRAKYILTYSTVPWVGFYYERGFTEYLFVKTCIKELQIPSSCSKFNPKDSEKTLKRHQLLMTFRNEFWKSIVSTFSFIY